ncbi:hypothetical protein [Streptomyces sp. WMMB303]|uniref:hypothetical protein n=1 Tax=unclassified Streptomyces TaxID=2593676 RepID=UPI0023ED58C9|nr:hypothetical protein [Streptomyces sp. WMMB303]MDF4252036.1 hypothetical protein [Streptomyces sp. WMMB303]
MAFTAFCVLYRQRYLEYAHNRLADARQADAVVHLAFAELAAQWDQALRSPHTNAYAWRLLSRRIRDHAPRTADEREEHRGDESPADHGDHAFLPDHTDDTRVLLQDLGMPLLEATEMMGHTAPRPR